MKKDIDLILLINKYLMFCKFHSDSATYQRVRAFLTKKINIAINKRSKNKSKKDISYH